jgi:hypothetical protein
MKTCARTNCIKPSIIRGKYCEEHRVRKKVNRPPILQPQIIEEHPQQNVIEEQERRLLIDSQNHEYDEAMRLDMIRHQEKEQEILEKVFKESEMDQVRQIVFSYEKNEDSFNIKFSINGKQQIQYFNHDALFKDIFQYIDLYLYDNNLDMEYELIYYPNNIFSKDEYNDKKIMDFFNCKCVSILVRNKNL